MQPPISELVCTEPDGCNFCPDWVAKLFSSFWVEQQTFLFGLKCNFEMFVSPPLQHFTLKAISHSWDSVISKVFIGFFFFIELLSLLAFTLERDKTIRDEKECILKLGAGAMMVVLRVFWNWQDSWQAKSQWFGCVGRSKVMFKVSKCSLFRVRLQHRLCDLWFYKPSSQLGWFELSPLFSSPSHLQTLASDLPSNLFLSFCSPGALTELTVALAGLVHHRPERPALRVCVCVC